MTQEETKELLKAYNEFCAEEYCMKEQDELPIDENGYLPLCYTEMFKKEGTEGDDILTLHVMYDTIRHRKVDVLNYDLDGIDADVIGFIELNPMEMARYIDGMVFDYEMADLFEAGYKRGYV